MRKATAKHIDRLIEQTFYANHTNVQIDIMDIGKIFAAGRAAFESAGQTAIAPAVAEAVSRLRKN